MAATLVDGVELFGPRFRDYPTDVESNDPADDLRGEAIDPVWPTTPTAELLATARLSYDRVSDTLHMRFHGNPRPILNVRSRGYIDLLVDLDTHEVVGLEVQKVLLKAVEECPELLNALDDAELRGITHDEVDMEKIRLLPRRVLAVTSLQRLLRRLTRMRRGEAHPKRGIVIDYYRNGCGRALS